MKKIIITLVSVFLLVLTSCQTVGEGSAEDVFNFRQDNWSLVHDSDFSAIKEVYVPESYNGYTYQEVLALALSKIDDPYYELVWGEPTVISPNGEYAVYISNKPDVVNGVFSFMLLKINLNQESVLFNLGSNRTPAYPLWWVDDSRFVYEYNGAYYICSIESPTEQILLSLEGEEPVILAYDGSTFLYVKNADNIGDGTRQIAVITADNQCEEIADFAEEQGTLMRESAINEMLHLAVMKGRLSADTDERYIRVYDYERDEYAQLPNPLIDNVKNVNAVDFYWEGTNLEVQYIVDDLVQEWSYHF